MAKNQKKKALAKHKQPQQRQEQKEGLSVWVWMLIGAAVGYAGWLAIRLISGLMGG